MKKILIIEDNIDVLENTAEILELAGYDVQTAPNGKIGVQKAKKELPDLILCDIMMPELDGYGVLYYLNMEPSTSTIPFVFLTAKSEKEDFRKGMELGADDYLTKPFEEIQLLKAIEMRLNKSQEIKAKFNHETEIETQEVIEFKPFKLKRMKRKEFIYLQGDQSNYIYKVKSGIVKTLETNLDGKELITGFFKEGDYFGYQTVIRKHERIDSATVTEDAEIEFYRSEDFYNVMSVDREFSNHFIKLLSSDLIEKEQEMLELAYDSVKQRVAKALAKYLIKHKSDIKDNKGIPILREDIANIAGTSTESVIRTLSEFKEDGLIEINGKRIFARNMEALQNFRH